MNNIKLKIGSILVVGMMTTSLYAYNEANAKGDCANAISRGGEFHKASHKHAVNKGHDSFKVTGSVTSRDDYSTHNFTCNVKHGRVVNWHVNHARKSNNSSGNNAAAVGAGILAIAALAALDNGNGATATHNNYNNNRYNDYDTGGNAFDDMRYLKKQCRQNLRHHLNRAHGRVNKLVLNTAHLNRKSLNGRGFVIFDGGDERDLDYNCVFDYRGEIRDGHYQFGRY